MAVFRRQILGDIAIVLDFQRLRIDTATVINGTSLESGNVLAIMTSVLDNYEAALSPFVDTVAKSERRVEPKTIVDGDQRD